ncbi:MAG: hypothetical protein Q6370_020615, partial [Candidatus Sigynarchaeota archaeon]
GRFIPLLQKGNHVRVEWNHWVSSFLPSDAGRPLVVDPHVAMRVFLRVYFSETAGGGIGGGAGNGAGQPYFQHWNIVHDRDGKEHWLVMDVKGGKRAYFEVEAAVTRRRIVGYLNLDPRGQATPLVDGFTAFVDPATRLPTARWDESVSDEAGTYDFLPPLVDADGTTWDLGHEDAPVLETQVEPTTWQCLNVLLPGWTFAPEGE